ncbi:Hypothetical predicted protein, partial [Paramuricea clavata]
MRSYAIAAAIAVIFVGIALYSSESSAGPAKVILKGAKKLLPKLAGRTIRIASAFGSRGIFRIPKVHRAFGYLKRTHPRVAKYLKISTGMFGGAGTAAGTQALIDYLDDEELMAEVQQIKTYAETVERQGEITQEEVEDLEGLIYGLSYALDEQKVLRPSASIWEITEKTQREAQHTPKSGWDAIVGFARVLRNDPVALMILALTIVSGVTTLCCLRMAITELNRKCKLIKGRTERRRARNRSLRRRRSGSSTTKSPDTPRDGEDIEMEPLP